MSRQPIQDLQGLDNVASPSANMVDAYAGAPAMPSQSSVTELADALGTLSRAGMKSVAKAKLEKQEMEAISAEKLANEFVPTENDPYLELDEFGKNFKYLDPSVLANILETKYEKQYYDDTTVFLNSLPSNVRFDSVEFEAAYNGFKDKALKETDGKFFVSAGAINGATRAYSDAKRNNIQEGRVFIEKEHVTAVNTKTFGFLEGKDLDDPAQFQAVVDAIIVEDGLQKGDEKVKGNSPFAADRVADKRIWRDTLIQQAKNNPLKGQQILNIVDALPWSGDNETKEAVKMARVDVVALALDKTQLNNAQLVAQIKTGKIDVDAKLDNLSADEDIEGLENILSTKINENASPLELALHSYTRTQARITLDTQYIDVEESNGAYVIDKQDLIVRASTGRAGTIQEEIAKIRANTTMSRAVKGAYILEVPTLLEGHKIVTSAAHKQQFTERLGGLVKGYEASSDAILQNLNLTKAMTSFEDEGKAVWNSVTTRLVGAYIEKNNNFPRGTALTNEEGTGIYDVAEDKTRARLDEVSRMTKEQIAALRPQPQPQPQSKDLELEVGKEYPSPDGGLVKYLGGDPEDDASFERVEEAVDPYKVTSEGDSLRGDARSQKAQAKKNEQAKQSVSNIFNKETATFDLTEDTLSKLTTLVDGRYKRASKRRQPVSEDSVMEMVLDQLGLDGVSDFEYGGIFGDDADTAGEIAIKKIVDSLMENQIGE